MVFKGSLGVSFQKPFLAGSLPDVPRKCVLGVSGIENELGGHQYQGLGATTICDSDKCLSLSESQVGINICMVHVVSGVALHSRWKRSWEDSLGSPSWEDHGRELRDVQLKGRQRGQPKRKGAAEWGLGLQKEGRGHCACSPSSGPRCLACQIGLGREARTACGPSS